MATNQMTIVLKNAKTGAVYKDEEAAKFDVADPTSDTTQEDIVTDVIANILQGVESVGDASI